jgi:uncharacterized integral membrane protein (TIGR00698 family)
MKFYRFFPFMIFSASSWCASAFALALGMVLSLAFEWPLPGKLKNTGKTLMQISIVGLGFTLDPSAVQRAGSRSVVVTLCSLLGIMTLAFFMSKILKVRPIIGSLIAAGTGICGGSAIAAMSPVIGATSAEAAVALATVFSLNAAALFLFPPLGHWLHLTPEQFGWWAAIAIHDTSSVVGAATQFHPDSVAVALTTKLTRALWIVPMVFGTSFVMKWRGDKSGSGKASVPLFIILFVGAVVLHTFLPDMPNFYFVLDQAGKSILKVAIFLIGAQLTRDMLRSVGARAMALGIILWFSISVATLSWVKTI